MRVEDLLQSADSGAALDKLASAFGVDPAAANAAIKAMLPEITNRIERNSFSRGGVADLVSALGNEQNQRVLEHPELAATPAARNIGNGALDVLFGSKYKSRRIAERASRASGLDPAITKQLLPALAAMVFGNLGKNAAPALDEVINKFPRTGGSPLPLPGEKPNWSSTDGGMDSLPDERPTMPKSGGASSGSPLPLPNDDILRRPRGDNPYGKLPDVIRRGEIDVPGGGSLSNIIRGILASILGYQNRGFLSWIIRLIAVRYGGAIIRAIFRRIGGAR